MHTKFKAQVLLNSWNNCGDRTRTLDFRNYVIFRIINIYDQLFRRKNLTPSPSPVRYSGASFQNVEDAMSEESLKQSRVNGLLINMNDSSGNYVEVCELIFFTVETNDLVYNSYLIIMEIT